jgi:hypothetical protein
VVGRYKFIRPGFPAAVLHDVAKPMRTALEGGRLTARGHAWCGAIEARRILWGLDTPFAAREQLWALVRWHQHPFFLIEREDARRQAIEISQTVRCDLLALLAEADARGRVGEGRERLIENTALFAEYCREQGCLDRPYAFASDHARSSTSGARTATPTTPPTTTRAARSW